MAMASIAMLNYQRVNLHFPIWFSYDFPMFHTKIITIFQHVPAVSWSLSPRSPPSQSPSASVFYMPLQVPWQLQRNGNPF